MFKLLIAACATMILSGCAATAGTSNESIVSYLGADNDNTELNTMRPDNIYREGNKVTFQIIPGYGGAKPGLIHVGLVQLQSGEKYFKVDLVSPAKDYSIKGAFVQGQFEDISKYNTSSPRQNLYVSTGFVPAGERVFSARYDVQVDVVTNMGTFIVQYPQHEVQRFILQGFQQESFRDKRKLF